MTNQQGSVVESLLNNRIRNALGMLEKQELLVIKQTVNEKETNWNE